MIELTLLLLPILQGHLCDCPGIVWDLTPDEITCECPGDPLPKASIPEIRFDVANDSIAEWEIRQDGEWLCVRPWRKEK